MVDLQLRDLVYRVRARGIVEVGSELKESASGHVETDTSRYVCLIEGEPAEITVVWTKNYLKAGGGFKVLSERPLTETQYNTIVHGKKFLDTEEALDEIKRSDERRARIEAATPSCPKCGQKMIVRDGPYSKFWGCPSYPKCHGIRKLTREYMDIIREGGG